MRLSRGIWIGWWLLLWAPLVAAQGRSERYPELGLRFQRPAEFEAVPLPPEEQYVKLRYMAAASGEEGRRRPGCDFVLLGEAKADGYLSQALQGWQVQEQRWRRQRWGFDTRAFDIRLGDDVGYVHAWESAERTWIFLGVCAEADATRFLPVLRRWAERTRLEAPRRDDRRRAELERRYGGNRWADPEHRIAVQLELVEGWQAHDSKHYIVIYHDLPKRQVLEVVEHIEVLRAELGRRFAAHLPADVVSTVRLCRDRDEYQAYGGPPEFAGHWNASAEELVLFDPGEDAPEELRRVLYHELFHQYIHHATGGIPPHPFFGEGWADYLSGAVLDRRRIKSIKPVPYRADAVGELVSSGGIVPWPQFLEMTPSEFYAHGIPAYTQAWSLVSFLESPEAQRDYRLRGRLGLYFETLRAAFAAERELYSDGPWLPQASYERARRQALHAFLDGLDWGHLESGWSRYVQAL